MHFLRLFVLFWLLSVASAAAQVAEPDPRPDDQFDFMNVLAKHDLHQLTNERWNAYGQFTHISSFKLPFQADYTNLHGTPNSLSRRFEHSFSTTATLYLGLRLWHGGEAYFVPEVISMRPLSGLKGLGSVIQNFEMQKNGSMTPTPYVARAYLRQTFGFGGHAVEQPSNPMQLGRVVDSRRLVLTAGNFSVIDVFDKNSYAGDLRRQFFNMAFMTYAAFDFAADARGYAWGAVLEYDHDDWAVRIGRFTPPKQPNQKPLDFHLYKHYGDQIEVEHTHQIWGETGVVRLLGYRNRERMGRFTDAVHALRADAAQNATTCQVVPDGYQSANAAAPDLCWARKDNVKWGVGLNLEQSLGYGIGVFARGMFSDGHTEVYSYTSTDRSLSLGALLQGSTWRRPRDVFGFGHSDGWISKSHARYLNLGGLDGFIGDGRISRGSERVTEIFYSVNILSSLWASVDYQHIVNPAYNQNRGPIEIFGVRLHAEF